jgi:hypothetical protein
VAVAAAIFVGVLAILLAGLYSQRGQIGAQLAVSYLRERGVPAIIQVDRLDPDGFTGSAVLGDPKDPDLNAPHIEVEFEPIPIFRSGLAAPRIRSIRLVEPRLKARWDGKKLTVGTLQRLVDDAAAKTPGTGPGPTVVIERGQVRLATPAGQLIADGDARMNAGRFASLSARLRPTTLRDGALTAQLAGATLTATARGPAIAATAHLDLPRLAQGGAKAEKLVADIVAQIPYDRAPRFDGLFSIDAKLSAAALTSAGQALAGPRLNLAFAGTSAGAVESLALRGSGTGSITAAGWTSPAGTVERLDLAGRVVGLDLARNGGNTRFSFDADFNGLAARVAAAGVASGQTRISARLERVLGAVSPTGVRVSMIPDLSVSTARASASGLALRDGTLELASSGAVLDWLPARWALAPAQPNASDTVLGRKDAGWSLSAPMQARLRAASLTQPVLAGNLTFTGFTLGLDGDATLGSEAQRLFLNGSARSQGGALSAPAARAFAAALPLIGTDPVGEAAITSAFRTARLDAPAFNIRSDSEGLRVSMSQPLQLIGADGARATVSALRSGPVAVSVGSEVRGGLVAHVGGARLPVLDIEMPLYQAGLDRGGLTLKAEARLSAAFDGANLHDLKLSAPARITRAGGVLSAALQDCAPVSLSAFGQAAMPLLTTVSVEACPDPAQPVVVLGPASWRFGARLKDFQADAPAGEARIRAGQGRIAMTGAGGGQPTGSAEIASARVTDGAAAKRFEPLALTGRLDLARDVWTGPIQVAEAAKGRRVATVRVTHAMATSTGSADISAPALAFAKDGLQPGQLSPLAATLITDAVGTVAFTGRADWSPAAPMTTSGRLTTAGVDFKSQFGLVRKATADLTFTSLAPLVTAPDQAVAAEEVSWLVPLTKASGRIAIRADRIAIDRAQADVSGGQVILDPLDLLYVPNSPMSGAVRLVQINLGALIKQFNLADKVAIEARIDGTVPFNFTNGALKLDKGHVFATGPGRLSIKREALTGTVATTAIPPSDAPGAPAPPPPAAAATSGVQAIAYQAMENLAFDKLEADIVSQPMGRLGILFKINGRNDPPGGGPVRIGLFDLLRGKALDNFTLPKGTPVNLTLDTSLNFDELLAAYNQRGRSEPVQQVPAKLK